MKAQLIMLQKPIIVSDEEIKAGDGSRILWTNNEIYSNKKSSFIGVDFTDCQKIIAGIPELPQIDWNNLENEFGWVDVGELAEKRFPWMDYGNYQDHYIEGYQEGFKKAQELNEKKFSFEDMQNCWRQAISSFKNESKIAFFDQFIEALQHPKAFDIEIEMENNQIKIIKNYKV